MLVTRLVGEYEDEDDSVTHNITCLIYKLGKYCS